MGGILNAREQAEKSGVQELRDGAAACGWRGVACNAQGAASDSPPKPLSYVSPLLAFPNNRPRPGFLKECKEEAVEDDIQIKGPRMSRRARLGWSGSAELAEVLALR
jgi:hypothetical protein